MFRKLQKKNKVAINNPNTEDHVLPVQKVPKKRKNRWIEQPLVGGKYSELEKETTQPTINEQMKSEIENLVCSEEPEVIEWTQDRIKRGTFTSKSSVKEYHKAITPKSLENLLEHLHSTECSLHEASQSSQERLKALEDLKTQTCSNIQMLEKKSMEATEQLINIEEVKEFLGGVLDCLQKKLPLLKEIQEIVDQSIQENSKCIENYYKAKWTAHLLGQNTPEPPQVNTLPELSEVYNYVFEDTDEHFYSLEYILKHFFSWKRTNSQSYFKFQAESVLSEVLKFFLELETLTYTLIGGSIKDLPAVKALEAHTTVLQSTLQTVLEKRFPLLIDNYCPLSITNNSQCLKAVKDLDEFLQDKSRVFQKHMEYCEFLLELPRNSNFIEKSLKLYCNILAWHEILPKKQLIQSGSVVLLKGVLPEVQKLSTAEAFQVLFRVRNLSEPIFSCEFLSSVRPLVSWAYLHEDADLNSAAKLFNN